MVLKTITGASPVVIEIDEPMQGIKFKNIHEDSLIEVKQDITGQSTSVKIYAMKVKHLVSVMAQITDGAHQLDYDPSTKVYGEFFYYFSTGGNINFSQNKKYKVSVTLPAVGNVEVTDIVNTKYGIPISIKKHLISVQKPELKIDVSGTALLFFEQKTFFSDYSTPVRTSSNKVMEFVVGLEQLNDMNQRNRDTIYDLEAKRIINGYKDGLPLSTIGMVELTLIDAEDLTYFYSVTI